MNRWRGWAQLLRRRHGRLEQRRTAGRMVLLHGAGSLTHVCATTRRTHVHVHARLGVTCALSLNVAGRHTTTVIRSSVGVLTPPETVHVGSAVPSSATPSPERAAAHVPYTSAKFVHAFQVRSVHEVVARRVASICELVSRWRHVSSIGSHARELPVAMRQRAVRQELPVPDRTTVLARRRIGATVVPYEPDAAPQAEVSGPRPHWAASQPAASAINVEAITSHVIQQLDRRLIAYRERMGRV